MRRRSFPRRARRMGAKRMDWVPSTNLCPEVVELNVCVDGVLPRSSLTFEYSLLSAQDVIDHTDKLTVLRVVGNIGFKFFPGTESASRTAFGNSCIIYEGVYVADTDDAGAFLVHNAGLSSDAEASWMWRNVRWLNAGGVFAVADATSLFIESVPVPHMQHVDIPVKRKLGDRNILVYTCVAVITQNLAFSVPPELTITGDLRTLVVSKG